MSSENVNTMPNNGNNIEPKSVEEEENMTDNKLDEEYESSSDDESDEDPLKCRMYENNYPEEDDLVMVEVIRLVGKGTYCNLLEYNNIEGFLLDTELSRKRYRSRRKIIREGQQHILAVYRVNEDKHVIDLSKKRVDDEEEIAKMEEKWSKSKTAHSMMRQISVLSNKKYSMKRLYKLFGWKCAEDFAHLCDAFTFAMNNWDEFISKYQSIPNDIQPILQKMIEKRLKPQMVTVRAEIEITCFTHKGVDAVKKALKDGLIVIDQENNKKGSDIMKLQLVAPPLFTISASTSKEQDGIELIDKVINVINKSITDSNGTLKIKQNAQIIGNDS